MRRRVALTFSLIISLIFLGCQPKRAGTSGNNNVIQSGDIVISNSGSKSLLLFDSAGKFKKVLGSLDNTSNEVYYGITMNTVTGQLLAVVDGTADSVQSFDVTDGSLVGTFISNSNLTGNLRGITQLQDGDLLIAETNNVERFSALGQRRTTVNSVVWPQALHNTGLGLETAPSGSFIHCSNGTAGTTDRVTLYTSDAGSPVHATAASPTPALTGTTGVNGCDVDSSGNVYAVFIGTSSYLRKYSADLTTTTWTYTDASILNPTDIAVRSDGTVLVLNSTLNAVISVEADGSDSQILQGDDVDLDDLLSTPQFIYIVP